MAAPQISGPPHNGAQDKGCVRRNSTERKRALAWPDTVSSFESRPKRNGRKPCSAPGQLVPDTENARSKRHAAYAEKYGAEALQAKLERKHQRQLEKQERPRRREHVKSARPTKTSGGRNTERRDDVPDGHHTAIIHPYQYVYPVRDKRRDYD
ncbi:hypothetical protein C8R47DRAFT_1084773 [Mycena vitilis]|nr:hypothetical protein C8R47DRAFT_1084773 [Mycena vitilis]